MLQCPDGAPPPCRPAQVAARPAAAPSASSIAVLPFANRSPDAGDAYLAEGLTEEIANRLTRVARLQVKARGLVNAQWQRTPDPFDAARRLNVAWFVHGNVRHVGQQLLVNVELVRATSGEEVWASRFPRPAADVFAVQAEVAESVAAVVGGRLSPAERAVIAARPTRDNEAYRSWLRGNALIKRRTQEEVREAASSFEDAIRRDPRYAAAWAGLGMARAIQHSWPTWQSDVPRDSLLSLSLAAVRRALDLDSSSAYAWSAAGYARSNAKLLWSARDAWNRALSLDSLSAEALHGLGTTFGVDCPMTACLGLYEAGAPYFRRALSVDPTLRNSIRHLALLTRNAGRLAEAEALLDSTQDMGPWRPGLLDRAYVRLLRGNAAGAIADAEAAGAIDSTTTLAVRAGARVLLGDSSAARELVARQVSDFPSMHDQARLNMLLGRPGEALALLARMRATLRPGGESECAPRQPCSVSLSTWVALHDPIFQPLRSDPRFTALLGETRPRVPWLPEYR